MTKNTFRRLPSQKVRGALITIRVLVQILLMISLRIEPLARRDNLGHNKLALVMLLLDFSSDPFGNLLLLGGMVKDGRAVLGADVGALGVEGGGVVHPVEEFDQVGVVDLVIRGVVDLECLCVLGRSCADLFGYER